MRSRRSSGTNSAKVGEWAARYPPDLNPELVRHSDAPRSVCSGRLPIIDIDEDFRDAVADRVLRSGLQIRTCHGELAADMITGERNDLYDPGFALAQHAR